LNDAQQFIDLVKAIVTMYTVPNGRNPHCHCSQTPLNSPVTKTSSASLTFEGFEQLFLKLIQEKTELLAQTKAEEPSKPDASEQAKTEIFRASKLDFTTVNEVYVPNEKCNMAKLTATQLG
jgi:hypothetical protein